MPEATQQFDPVNTSTQQPSVGAVQQLPEDTTFRVISKYAEKLNAAHIKTAREKQYIEGQLLAAQVDGVQEVRDNTPWVAKLFGGGATLSGAMDYMERTRLLEYQQSINDNMETLRTLRPEDFKQRQMSDIQQFMTDDDETNARIMKSFGTILPSVVKAQTKEHESFVQEQHLGSMTKFVTMALDAAEAAKSSGDPDDIAAANEALYNGLDRPAGMNTDAYKKFLYDSLGHAAATGDEQVMQKIAALGLIEEPADLDKLDKAEQGLAKYHKQQQVFEYGKSLSTMKEMAENVSVDDATFAVSLEAAADKYGYSPEQIASLMNQRHKSLVKQSTTVNYEQNVQLIRSGAGNQIPMKQRQDTLAIMDEGVRQNKIPATEYIHGLAALGIKSRATSERWRAGIIGAVVSTEDGIKVSDTGAEVLSEMDKWYAVDEDTTLLQMDDETAAIYKAYRYRRVAMNGASPASILQSAMEDVTAAKEAPRKSLTQDQRDANKEAFLDNSPFKEDHFNNKQFAADYTTTSGMFGGTPDPAAVALRSKLLSSKWEVRGDKVYPKVDNKPIAQWVGVDDPIGVVEAMNRAGMFGETQGHDITVQPKQREGYFALWSNSAGQVLATVPFQRVATHARMGQEVHTTDLHEQNFTELKQRARKVIRQRMLDDTKLDHGFGPNIMSHTTAQVKAINQKIADMTDEELLAHYDAIQSESTPFEDMLKSWGEKLYNGSADPVAGLNPIGRSIANMLGYYGDEEVQKTIRADQVKAERGFNMITYGKRKHTSALQIECGLSGNQVDGRVGEQTLSAIMIKRGISHKEAMRVANDALNADRVLHAVGMYQVIGNTLKDTYEQAGLTLDTVFDAEAQDALFEKSLIRHQPDVAKFLDGKKPVEYAISAIRQEWIGLNNATNQQLFDALVAAKASDYTKIKRLIQTFEADTRGYESYNRGGVSGGAGIFFDNLPENLTGKTIREILTQQSVL